MAASSEDHHGPGGAARKAAPFPKLPVELRVVAEDAVFVERDTALGGKVGCDALLAGDAAVQSQEAWPTGAMPRHGDGEGVAKPFDHLEEAEIDVGERIADQMPALRRVGGERPLEVAEIFRDPILAESFGGAQRLRLLVFIVEA